MEKMKALAKDLNERYQRVYRLTARALSLGLVSREDARRFHVEVGKRIGRLASAEQGAFLLSRCEEQHALLIEMLGPAEVADHETREHAVVDSGDRMISSGSRIGSMPVDELEELGKRQRVVQAMNAGATAASALKSAGLPVTSGGKRRAQRLFAKWRQTGELLDARERNSRSRFAATPEMTEAIRAIALQHRAANCTAIRNAIENHVERLHTALGRGADISTQLLGLSVAAGTCHIPSSETIRRVLNGFDAAFHMLRKQGSQEVRRQLRPTFPMRSTEYANEIWEADNLHPDTWVKVEVNGVWTKARAYATAIIDVHSRAIMAIMVSARCPDANATAIALRAAIRHDPERVGFGYPGTLVLDNGPDFASKQVAAFCSAISTKLHYCKPHNPDEKPHIEAFFRTLQSEVLTILPGYKKGGDRGNEWTEARIDGLLTVPDLQAEVDRWILQKYHVRPHSSTGVSPNQLWQQSARSTDLPNERDLDALLLYRETRRVARATVRLSVNGQKGRFWGPCLIDRSGETLTVRFNPDDLQSILAYDANDAEFVGELWNLAHPECPYTKDDVKRAWSHRHGQMLAERASLADRLPLYHNNAMKNDRVQRRKRQVEYAETAKFMESASPPPSEDTDMEMMDLLAEVRRSMARPSTVEQETNKATQLPQSA